MSQEGGRGSKGRAADPSLCDAEALDLFNSDNSAGASSGGSENRGGGGSDVDRKPAQLYRSCSSSPSAGANAAASTGGGRDKQVQDGTTKKDSCASSGGKRSGEWDHEMHIWTERERRKRMRNMFSNLHALLPHLPPKADKSTIVDEAVNYLKALQQNLQKLQMQKLERMRGAAFEDASSSAVALRSAQLNETATTTTITREAFMADQVKNWPVAMNSPTTVSISRFPQTLQTWSSPNVVLSVAGEDAYISICAAKKIGILPMTIYVLEKHKLEVVSATISSDYCRSMLLIHAHASGISDQFPETFMIEEVYKMAVGEMILWLSSQ